MSDRRYCGTCRHWKPMDTRTDCTTDPAGWPGTCGYCPWFTEPRAADEPACANWAERSNP